MPHTANTSEVTTAISINKMVEGLEWLLQKVKDKNKWEINSNLNHENCDIYFILSLSYLEYLIFAMSC